MSLSADPPLGALLAQLSEVFSDPGTEAGVPVSSARSAATRSRRLVPLPSARRPRLLVPRAPRAAAAAVRSRGSAADRGGARAARTVLAAAMAAGAGRFLPGTVQLTGARVPLLVVELADRTGVSPDDMTFSVSVGAARANAKPVLAVHDRRGRVVLWVKVATTPLAARLVHDEDRALRRLHDRGLRRLAVPTSHGVVQTSVGPALLLEPLRGRAVPPRSVPRLPVQAFAEIATSGGTSTEEPSAWVARHAGPDVPQATGALWAERHPGVLTTGWWHGDWGPWNMSWAQRRPQVWDWERSGPGAPVGVDAVHFAAHTRLRALDVAGSCAVLDRTRDTVVAPVLRSAGVPCGVAEADAVVDAYLLLVHHRFSTEGAQEPTGAVARLAQHYLAVLEARLRRPVHGPGVRGGTVTREVAS